MFRKKYNYDELTKEELKELLLKLKYEYYCAKKPSELRKIRKALDAINKELLERKKEKQKPQENKRRK